MKITEKTSRKSFWNVTSKLSLVFLIVITLLALFGPLTTPYSFDEQNISARLLPPNSSHWMGTDLLGRDLYSRMIYGARMSLVVALVSTLVSLFVGTFLGALAGYLGGWVDALLMHIVDLFMIFPSVLLAILLSLVFGRGMSGILIALGLTAWVTHARLVRGQVLQIRELTYIEAAKALGLSPLSLLKKHVLPNLWNPILALLVIQIPSHMMTESFLSFIGLGLQPPYSSWGTLANEGFRAIQSYPHLILFPGAALFLTTLAFNYLGDGLSDEPASRV